MIDASLASQIAFGNELIDTVASVSNANSYTHAN